MRALVKMMLAAALALALTSPAAAELTLAGYQDFEHEITTVSLTGGTALPAGFGLWGFVDFCNQPADDDARRADPSAYYGEANIYYKVQRHFRLHLEINDGSESTALVRPGFKLIWLEPDWRFSFKVLPWREYLAEPPFPAADAGQVGLAWHLDFFGGIGFFEGQLDVNYYYDGSSDYAPVLFKPLLGVMLDDRLAFLVQFNYSNFNREEWYSVDVGLGWVVAD